MSGVAEWWGGFLGAPAGMEQPRQRADMSARLALVLQDLERKRLRTVPCETQADSANTSVFEQWPGSSLASATPAHMLTGISADRALLEGEQTEAWDRAGGQALEEPRAMLAPDLAGPPLRQDKGTGNSSFWEGGPHDRDALGSESTRGNTLALGSGGPQAEPLPACPLLLKAIASSALGGQTQAGAIGHAQAGATGHAQAGATGHAQAGATGHAQSGATGHGQAGATGHAQSGATGHGNLHAGCAPDLRPVAPSLASLNDGGAEGSFLSLEEFLNDLQVEAPMLSADDLSWLDNEAPELPSAPGPDHSLQGASRAAGVGPPETGSGRSSALQGRGMSQSADGMPWPSANGLPWLGPVPECWGEASVSYTIGLGVTGMEQPGPEHSTAPRALNTWGETSTIEGPLCALAPGGRGASDAEGGGSGAHQRAPCVTQMRDEPSVGPLLGGPSDTSGAGRRSGTPRGEDTSNTVVSLDVPLFGVSHVTEWSSDALMGAGEERTSEGKGLQSEAWPVLSGGGGLRAMPQTLPLPQAAEAPDGISLGHKRKGPGARGARLLGDPLPLLRREGSPDKGKALLPPGEEAQALEGLFSKRRAADGTFSPARPPRSLRVSDKCVPAFAPLARRLGLAEMEKRILLWGEALVRCDMARAKVLERGIRTASSPVGDYVQRLGALFLRAIKLRGTIAGAKEVSLDHILKGTLKLTPEAAQSLPEFFRHVPLVRLCQSVGLHALLDAADGQPYVHVVVLGNDNTSKHISTVEALAMLPQGGPRQLRFTVLDPCFGLPQSMRALKEATGKALGGKLLSTVNARSRLKFLYSYVPLTEVSVWGLHELECLQARPQTSGTRETLVVISNLNLSHIPGNGNLQPNPRQVLLEWIRGMRPDIFICEEPLVDLSKQTLQGSIRGCLDNLAPLFALHDCYLRDLDSDPGQGSWQGLRPGAPASRGADASRGASEEAPAGQSVGVPRSSATDVSKHVFRFEECIMGTQVSLSLASTPSQPLMHSLGLRPLKALLRAHGFAELPIPDALQTLIPQIMRGCPRELTATVERGCISFCCRGQPIAVSSLWAVGNGRHDTWA